MQKNVMDDRDPVGVALLPELFPALREDYLQQSAWGWSCAISLFLIRHCRGRKRQNMKRYIISFQEGIL